MNTKNIIYALGATLLLCACAKESEPQQQPDDQPGTAKFTAFSEPLTKTVVSDDLLSVCWSKGDALSLISEGKNRRFTTDKDGVSSPLSPASSSDDGEIKKDTKSIWGIYPYSEDCIISDDGSTVTVSLPHEQKIDKSGLSAGANVSVAYLPVADDANELDFCNVASYILLDIPDSERIVECTIHAEPSAKLAGKVRVRMDKDGIPAVEEIVEGQESVALVSEYPFDGKCLVPVLPQAAAATYSVDVKRVDGTVESGYFLSDGEVILRRNQKTALVKPVPESVTTPELSVLHAFWSDATLSMILPSGAESVKVILNGSEIGEASGNGYHLTGLDSGSEYSVKISASVKGKTLESNEVTFTTGKIEQLTKNVSPTSVAVGIENRAGALSGNYKPCLHVQLFESEDVSGTPKYEAFVRDNEVLSEGHPFYKSLVAGSGTTYAPFNLAFGGLEAGKDYWFRVKSVASETYQTYRAASISGESRTMESQNGDSDYSKPFRLTTAQKHASAENEVLFEGFDDCFFSADFINCAVGLMPAIRTFAQKHNPSTTLTPSDWTAWASAGRPWCFHGLRTGLGGTSTTAFNWWTKQVGEDPITFEGSAAKAVRYWVTTDDGTVLAPKAVAGEKLGPVKKNKGLETLGGTANWFMTGNTSVGEGYLVLSRLYGYNDAESAAPGGIFTPPLSSDLLNTTEKTICTISFKALAVQGVSGKVKVLRLDKTANHRNATSDLWTEIAEIKVANSNGNTDETASEWSAQNESHRWYDYSCEVSLLNGDLIGFVADKTACVCIDDIRISIQ